MVGAQQGPFMQPAAHPRQSTAHSTRWVLVFLQLVIGIAAIVGVAAALSMGYPTVAIVVALVAGAFFAGSAC